MYKYLRRCISCGVVKKSERHYEFECEDCKNRRLRKRKRREKYEKFKKN